MRKYLVKYKEAAGILVFEWVGMQHDINRIIEGFRSLAYLLIWLSVRIIMLLTLPISAAIFAYAKYVGDKQQVEAEEKARARMRRGIHQNGSGDEDV